MKIDINKFRVEGAEPADAPLDFATLCTLLARHQAETPTARLARDGEWTGEPSDHASQPAVAVLLSGPGQPTPASSQAHGSFHAAAAALFNPRS